ncbi:MAG: response regulator [Prevotella sp.]|nr:response regulator [Prevotella sp.]
MARLYNNLKHQILITVLSLLPLLGAGALERVGNFDVPTSDELRCVTFDHKGYMWIGTSSGLFRYDGYQFQSYRSSLTTPGLLTNNYIQCIVADAHNQLWIGTDEGVTRMNVETGAIDHFMPQGHNQRIVYAIYCSRRGDVWAGTDGGLLRFSAVRRRFELVDLRQYKKYGADGKPISLDFLNVKSCAEDHDGMLYFGTWDRGVVKMDPVRRRITQLPSVNNNAYALCFDDKGNLWSGGWEQGLSVVTRHGLATSQTPRRVKGTETARIYRIVYDSLSHSVVVCSRNAIYRFGSHEADKATLTSANIVSGNLHNYLSDLAVNARGDIATITFNNDLLIYSPTPSPLTLSTLNGYAGKINALYTDDGHHFMLASGNWKLLFYDIRQGTYANSNAIIGISELPQDNCSSIARRANGDLWMGFYYFGGLVMRQGTPAQTINFRTLPQLYQEGMLSLLPRPNGDMWVGQWTSIALVHPDNSGFTIDLRKYFPAFYRGRVVNLSEDHAGRIWACVHEYGIVRIDRYRREAADAEVTIIDRRHNRYPSAGAIACIEDNRHRVWSVTSEGELVRWDEKQQRFVDDPRYAQLKEHRIYAINQDREGNLWLAARNYLIRMSVAPDGSLQALRFFSPRNGAGLKLQENATYRWGDQLYFGGVGQVLQVDTRVLSQPIPARRSLLCVTNLTLNDRPFQMLDSTDRAAISDVSPAYARHIVIPHHIRRFGITFSALSFNDNGETLYAYWLEGYNRDWVVCDNGTHEARFENMPSGTYRLHLRSVDADGQWQDMPYTVEIRVMPPWWAAWWAWLIYAALAALAVYGVTRWYKARLRTRNRLGIARVFTNITHELLTPIAVISASVDAARGQLSEEKYAVIHNNTNRLTRLIRQILEVDKLNTGRVRLLVSQGDLTRFLEKQYNNMRPLAEQKHIRMDFTVEGTPEAPTYFDPDKVDKMVYNLLSNAVKYTPEGGHITLACHYPDQESVAIRVTDNGIGIPAAKLKNLYSRFMDGDYRKMETMGTGIGLSLTRDLVLLHHGHIDCQSLIGQGTTFTLTLPTARQAYTKEEVEVDERELSRRIDTEQMAVNTAITQSTDLQESTDDNPESREYTVLVVEDNVDLLQLMKEMLGRHYHILTAKDGRQALNIIARNALDLVVSDVMMPVMDGIELTRAIKGNDDYAMLPVILLTAKVRNEDRREGYQVGADDYLAKPFDMETLKVRIDNFMANRERLRRKFMAQTDFRPEEQHYSDPNVQFMGRAVATVKEHLADADYDRERFAADMCMSSSLLYKKLTALTGQNVSAFVNSIKLKEACAIARREPDITVSDLYVRLGYSSPSYFSRLFKKEFDMTFTEYIAQQKGNENEDENA